MKLITCTAPVNIAVIKYWGKRDDKLILPINDSLSATLNQHQMCAKTTVAISESFTTDKIWLNGKEESIDNPRLQNCLKEIRRRASGLESKDMLGWCVHICSENNFPTAAGLASSAAGYACLVFSLSRLYDVEGDISYIARQGSGSACRSVDGGFVWWHMGQAADGSDSLARQVVSADHWPDMRVLILVVSDDRKKTSSALGMRRSVDTSSFLKHRALCVPTYINTMVKAIQERNFEQFAELTMQDSNQLHAVCLDTFPPCKYMNDVSHRIIELTHHYNSVCGSIKVAYTFDAGPNACLFLLEKDVASMTALVQHCFPMTGGWDRSVKGLPIPPHEVTQNLLCPGITDQQLDALRYIIHTNVGDGPRVLTDPSQHLLNDNGLPKFVHLDNGFD